MVARLDQEMSRMIQQGIAAVRQEEYLLGYVLLTEAYAEQSPNRSIVDGLSHFAVCLALMEKKMKPAIDLCQKAIEIQFYNAEHYINLARIYDAGGVRKKAIETLEKGLTIIPDDPRLKRARESYGYRRRPPVPFLDRSNPVNRALGHATVEKKEERPVE